jgi:hypothetical protein
MPGRKKISSEKSKKKLIQAKFSTGVYLIQCKVRDQFFLKKILIAESSSFLE